MSSPSDPASRFGTLGEVIPTSVRVPPLPPLPQPSPHHASHHRRLAAHALAPARVWSDPEHTRGGQTVSRGLGFANDMHLISEPEIKANKVGQQSHSLPRDLSLSLSLSLSKRERESRASLHLQRSSGVPLFGRLSTCLSEHKKSVERGSLSPFSGSVARWTLLRSRSIVTRQLMGRILNGRTRAAVGGSGRVGKGGGWVQESTGVKAGILIPNTLACLGI